jgi:glucose/arabinose dehydrogenase
MMVRINKSGTIPTTNPFYSTATGSNRAIWALGLRNPFKFAVERALRALSSSTTSESTLGKRSNRGASSANYGWPVYEGPTSDPTN